MVARNSSKKVNKSFDQFVQNNPLAMALINSNGEILESNLLFQDLYSLNNILKIVPINIREELHKEIHKIISSKHKNGQFTLKSINKTLFTLFKKSQESSDDEYYFIIKNISLPQDKNQTLEFTNNLEEQVKQRTRELTIQKETFQKLYDESPMGELLIRNGMFIDCNKKVLEILGYKNKGEFLPCDPGKLSPEFQPDGMKSIDKAKEMIQKAFVDGSHSFEWKHIRKNGEEFWCEIYLLPINLHGSKDIIHVGWRDINDEKVKDELHHIVEKSQKVKEILLRVLLHDIASPLMVIDIISKKIQKENPSDYFQKITRSIDSINSILSSIRKIEAIESGKMDLDPKPVDINQIIDNVINHNEELLYKKSIRINKTYEVKKDTLITTDPTILTYQILSNLITNSIKFTNVGDEIDINIYKTDNNIIIEVRDYGIGMPEDLINDLFDWEKQTSREGTSGEAGTGFGMPIVKRFIEELNHSISIESWTQETTLHRKGTSIKIHIKSN